MGGGELDLVVRVEAHRDCGCRFGPRGNPVGGRRQWLYLDPESVGIPGVYGGLILRVPCHVGSLGTQRLFDLLVTLAREVVRVEESEVDVLDVVGIQASGLAIPDQVPQHAATDPPVWRVDNASGSKYVHEPRAAVDQAHEVAMLLGAHSSIIAHTPANYYHTSRVDVCRRAHGPWRGPECV